VADHLIELAARRLVEGELAAVDLHDEPEGDGDLGQAGRVHHHVGVERRDPRLAERRHVHHDDALPLLPHVQPEVVVPSPSQHVFEHGLELGVEVVTQLGRIGACGEGR